MLALVFCFKNSEQKEGVRVSVTNAEIITQTASVFENSRNSLPGIPPINPTKINTAASIRLTVMIVPAVSLIDCIAAWCELRFCSAINVFVL